MVISRYIGIDHDDTQCASLSTRVTFPVLHAQRANRTFRVQSIEGQARMMISHVFGIHAQAIELPEDVHQMATRVGDLFCNIDHMLCCMEDIVTVTVGRKLLLAIYSRTLDEISSARAAICLTCDVSL